MRGPTSLVRENIYPGTEQCKSLVWKLFLPPMKEDHSSVRVATKTGKKHQGERNDQEKIKNIRPSERVLNQYASPADGCDSKFDRVKHSEQNVDLHNVKNRQPL